jgi:hypothetical protein
VLTQETDIYEGNIKTGLKEMWFQSMEWIHLAGYVPVVRCYENGDELLGLRENVIVLPAAALLISQKGPSNSLAL